LRVTIDEQNAPSLQGNCGSEIYGGRGLPDATFLVGDGYNFSHDSYLWTFMFFNLNKYFHGGE
jgi:hypothetical protein